MKTVSEIWECLIDYWKVNEPNFKGCKCASEEEIQTLESTLNITLPKSLRQSLEICNFFPEKIDKSSSSYFGGCSRLYDTRELLEMWDECNTYRFSGFPYRYIDSRIKPEDIGWSTRWIPIFHWNADIFALLDMREDIGDRTGQILYEDSESGILGIWADSYEEFLESIANAVLDHGEFGIEDIKDKMQQVYEEIGIN